MPENEEGTKYLFEEKLGCPLIEMTGNEHADGGVTFPNGELLLWDNKGKESIYEFPKSHFDQFRKYIRESTKRVNVFLVVAPPNRQQCQNYRNETEKCL